MVINNGIIIQWGYSLNVPYGSKIYFPISFNQFARCIPSVVNTGYLFINTIEIQNPYFSASVYTSAGQQISSNILWIAVGY